ncbi:MAG TPA: Mrp/NBP35 family ATP-binding protein [Candidatus Limnocylindrales bacterium]|nr:Mrp/NBP35 family ATP-binding protein [Candidatus Limnocylindrales bacterium]
MTESDIREHLKSVKYPGFTRDIVSFGVIKSIALTPDRLEVRLNVLTENADVARQIVSGVEQALASLQGIPPAAVVIERQQADAGAQARDLAKAMGKGPKGLPGVRRIVAVASGKGGVGKSTVASNLAVALARRGLRVGLLDADLYGPSMPTMFGVGPGQAGASDEEGRFVPAERYGVRLVSMGFFVGEGAPLIWRGPMLTKALNQFLMDVAWGELDVMVLDLPPGTGDIQMTLTQTLAMDAGIIVTTPQDVALADVERGLKMFQQAQVPVLGVVENMSFHVCPGCGAEAHIFGHGGGAAMAQRVGLSLLGSIPLVRGVREAGDAGAPVVAAEPASAAAAAFVDLADRVIEGVQVGAGVVGHA